MSKQASATTKTIKIPGPDHPITIEPNPQRVVVTIGGAVVAESRDALILREAGYPPVQYIPRKDVDMTRLVRSAHTTYCPYKGDCAYFSISLGGSAASTPPGPTKHPTTWWRPSGTTWLFILTVLTASKSVPRTRSRTPASRRSGPAGAIRTGLHRIAAERMDYG